MASGDTLHSWAPEMARLAADWVFLPFTSGSTEPSLGDTIWGDTSDENGVLQYLSLESGTWGGADAAGYMLLDQLSGLPSDWTSGENWTANTSTPGNHGTGTGLPRDCIATPGTWSSRFPSTLDFDDTDNEIALFPGFMPRHYGGSGITLTVGVLCAANTGDLSYKAFCMSLTDDVDNLNTKNFATPQENTAIDAASAVGEVKYFTIAFTDGAQMDSIAAGEFFFLMLMRDAQDGTNDDMVGDASVMGLELKET